MLPQIPSPLEGEGEDGGEESGVSAFCRGLSGGRAERGWHGPDQRVKQVEGDGRTQALDAFIHSLQECG